MQQFLQFRLGCHGLPIATGRLAGIAMIGTSDQSCWLAEAFQVLLLLLGWLL